MALLLLGALAVAAAGCASGTTINKVLAEPQKYTRGDIVHLHGDVVESVSLLGHGAYRLDDGTGSLWVISTHGVPRQGARVKVEGKIRDVADVGSVIKLPPQIRSGLVMTDATHHGQ
jgi:hypothetical protein